MPAHYPSRFWLLQLSNSSRAESSAAPASKIVGDEGEKFMSIRSIASRHLPPFKWKNPMVNAALKVADSVDYIARLVSQRTYIPPYSIRVRSTGFKNDFGAARFQAGGRRFTNLLRTHAKLTPDSRILEIGCACGRTAFGLAEILNDGNYIGMDIERVSLASARANSKLRRKGFQFELLDIRNGGYNPEGKYLATEYVFPYRDESFDIVFMTSVFTHMLTDEVLNYARQIARVLKPGGCCLLTAYLLDREMTIQFPFKSQEHSYMNEEIPEFNVAYRSEFLISTFANNGMLCTAGPLWGPIHGGKSEIGGVQDIMVFTKQ
jgi:SAM-dependent methyltransferase